MLIVNCFFWGFFWKKSWFEFQCLMIAALLKWKKNRLVLMFFWSLAFNEKKGHLMWISLRTIGSFQCKTTGTAAGQQQLQQLQVLIFLSSYKVANTSYCCFHMSQWETELWMQSTWRKCMHTWVPAHTVALTQSSTPTCWWLIGTGPNMSSQKS